MKKVVLMASAILLAVGANAQSFETKNSINIRLGQSTPIADFSSVNSDNDGSGYAMNGINFGINYERTIDNNMALTVGLSSSGNTFNTDIYEEQLTNSVQNELQSDDFTFKVDDDIAYGAAFFNVGMKYSFGGEKVKMYINPVFGMSSFINPEQKATLREEGNTQTGTITTDEATDISFAFGANTGFSIRASELISINLNFEYINSSFQLDLNNTTESFGGTVTRSDFTTVQKYEVLNTTIGVGFNF